jgi:hypothetical protein
VDGSDSGSCPVAGGFGSNGIETVCHANHFATYKPEGRRFTQPLTEIIITGRKVMFLVCKARPVSKRHNLTAIREPSV